MTTPATLRISINESGAPLWEAITLNFPPRDVPETGSVAMLVSKGLSGEGVLLRKRNRN